MRGHGTRSTAVDTRPDPPRIVHAPIFDVSDMRANPTHRICAQIRRIGYSPKSDASNMTTSSTRRTCAQIRRIGYSGKSDASNMRTSSTRRRCAQIRRIGIFARKSTFLFFNGRTNHQHERKERMKDGSAPAGDALRPTADCRRRSKDRSGGGCSPDPLSISTPPAARSSLAPIGRSVAIEKFRRSPVERTTVPPIPLPSGGPVARWSPSVPDNRRSRVEDGPRVGTPPGHSSFFPRRRNEAASPEH